ncbi:YcaO-like family protein [Lentzea sp. NBC_00516]|uniref:YcaO-like family protein n=1 Tax=Lentzea sp. NBC_00516 TaxID=2903582 RepID=UPI002E805BE3|nr:YcaO-like family protein [Lentzea sp. NBC_00516]WUD25954.1 YcaO-like family protein [Lentzea sp. NBC_00516]
MTLHRLTSSLRTAQLHETLARAKEMAAGLGISRVTETTWLDVVGIPVFAGIRPDAVAGSLCVSAGKGSRPEEARVGAYLEAIELAVSEYRRRHVDVVMSTPRAVAGQAGSAFEFVDLCPRLGRQVDPDGPLACVRAEEISTGTRVLLPAELVFFPYGEDDGQLVFGSGTTGLASGNTVDEATVHALAEVIERDVCTFNLVRDASRHVVFDRPEGVVGGLLEKVRAAGLRCAVRCTDSVFGLPHFEAYLMEPSDETRPAIAVGSGLHPLRDVAAVRAVSEAAQSRLTAIHGGRDDLLDRYDHFARFGEERELAATARLRARVSDTSRSIRYEDVPEGPDLRDLGQALAHLIGALRRGGVEQVFRVVLSAPDAPLAVVRLVVPRMESFHPSTRRVGPRLAAALGKR